MRPPPKTLIYLKDLKVDYVQGYCVGMPQKIQKTFANHLTKKSFISSGLD